MHKRAYGFTIVELLIVIVVIAVLATISIVSYTGIQNRAIDSSIKNDLASFKKNMELVKVDTSDGLYPATPTTAMGFKFSKESYATNRHNLYYCTSPDRAHYALGVVAKRTTNQGFTISDTDGISGPSSSVDSATTCAIVSGSSSQLGYSNTTSAWASWVN